MIRLSLSSGPTVLKGIANSVDAALWRRLRYRPRLNADSVARWVTGTVGDEVTGGRLIARVAFHYVPWRLKYLVETVAALKALPFQTVHVVIDTNTKDFGDIARDFLGDVEVSVWDRLEDPFRLTWVHREAFADVAGDYDTFMYVEDDIIVPAPTMRRWLVETERLTPHGFLPGLVRVERHRSGATVFSDFRAPVGPESVVEIGGRPYLATPYPYQAFWVYQRAQLKAFMASPSFLDGPEFPDALLTRDRRIKVRERAAFGMIFDDVPQGFLSRSLVPLDDRRIPDDAMVFHAPSNYGLRRVPHRAGLAQVRLGDEVMAG